MQGWGRSGLELASALPLVFLPLKCQQCCQDHAANIIFRNDGWGRRGILHCNDPNHCACSMFHVARARRYTSPDEYPFTSPLPGPVIPALDFPSILHKNDINVNSDIMDRYLQDILPRICVPGDDLNYGSSATRDVECLQALSKRIHYGK